MTTQEASRERFEAPPLPEPVPAWALHTGLAYTADQMREQYRAGYEAARAVYEAPPVEPGLALAEARQIETYLDGRGVDRLDDRGGRLSIMARMNILTRRVLKAKVDLAESRYQTAQRLAEKLEAAEEEVERLRAMLSAVPGEAPPNLALDVLRAYDEKLTEVWGKESEPHAYAYGWVRNRWKAATAAGEAPPLKPKDQDHLAVQPCTPSDCAQPPTEAE
jgi:hypothetical protein